LSSNRSPSTPSPLTQYPRTLWRWRWLLLAITAICSVTSLLVSLQLPKTYQVTAVALVSPKQVIPPSGGTTPVDPNQLPGIDNLVQTYIALVNTAPVRERLAASGIPRTPGELTGELFAIRQPNTTLIAIAASDRDPGVALAIGKQVIPAFNAALDQLQQNVGVSQQSHLDSLVAWEVPADAPLAPVKPDIVRNVLIALGAGLVAAVVVAFVLERLDNTIKDEVTVRTRLDLPVLVSVARRPAAKGQADAVETVASNHLQDALSEQYRALRTGVLFSTLDTDLKTLLVTSTAPNEGKTTTATNLALVLAQGGSKVILVDADFRRPAMHRVLERPDRPGLGDFLLHGDKDLDNFAHQVAPNLMLLTSGTRPPNPAELVGSELMKRALDGLAAVADYVIVDSPPVGAVTDATVLGALVDGVILVIEQGGTPIPKIERALATLEAVGANILGVVLNKANRADSYFYYYYGTEPTEKPPRRGWKTAVEGPPPPRAENSPEAPG
jgi:capsular exopolysaccharide synthesis family protein